LNDGIRTVVLMAVPAEDDDGWQVEFERDEGQRQRVLHFASKKDAELWIGSRGLTPPGAAAWQWWVGWAY
jgi:hypothetical protein